MVRFGLSCSPFEPFELVHKSPSLKSEPSMLKFIHESAGDGTRKSPVGWNRYGKWSTNGKTPPKKMVKTPWTPLLQETTNLSWLGNHGTLKKS